MRDHIDCRVASGGHLRFILFKEGRPLSPMGGNYLYVKDAEDGPRVVCIGMTDNLALHARARWAEAQARFGAEGLYTRLNFAAAVRRREHLELLETLDPPMNADESPLVPGARDASTDQDGATAAGL